MSLLSVHLSHPRLFLTEADLQCFSKRDFEQGSYPDRCLNELIKLCEENLPWKEVDFPSHLHNPLLLRARITQKIVWSLCLYWQHTREDRVRQGILAYLREMGRWTYWSSDCMQEGEERPDANFDLSYGENCFTLALAYDLMVNDLESEDAAEIRAIAFNWGINPGRKFCQEAGAKWFGRKDSNWNTVCAGGLGALVLAMAEHIDDAAELLMQVDRSFQPYFDHLNENKGGWPEGLGYWNYGMRYAFLYLLSWEQAMGKAHPLMALEGSQQTVHFPLDFCPQGACVGFGDVNRWRPLPFHLRLAARFGEAELLSKLKEIFEKGDVAEIAWPMAALSLAFWGDGAEMTQNETAQKNQVLYQPMGWGVLKCEDPQGIYVSLRGGSSKVPHSHQDLMSISVVVGDEAMIMHHGTDYLDTTFSPRRYDIPEISALYKNTLFVNGVSLPPECDLDETSEVQIAGYHGMRMVGTKAMGNVMRNQAMLFLGRVVLRISDEMVLIVDRCHLPAFGLFEVRYHTEAEVVLSPEMPLPHARLQGQRQQMYLSFASEANTVLAQSGLCSTIPGEAAGSLIRFGSLERGEPCSVYVTVMSLQPVEKLNVACNEGAIQVTWGCQGSDFNIAISDNLTGMTV